MMSLFIKFEFHQFGPPQIRTTAHNRKRLRLLIARDATHQQSQRDHIATLPLRRHPSDAKFSFGDFQERPRVNSRELIRAPPETLLSTSSNNKIGPLPGREVDRRISQYRELTVADTWEKRAAQQFVQPAGGSAKRRKWRYLGRYGFHPLTPRSRDEQKRQRTFCLKSLERRAPVKSIHRRKTEMPKE